MSSLVTSLLHNTTSTLWTSGPHDTKATILVLFWFKTCKVTPGPWNAKQAQYCGALQQETEGIHCLPQV